LVQGRKSSRASEEEYEEASRKGIERSSVADSRLTSKAAHFRNDIVTRWPVGLVDEQDAVNAWSAWASTRHRCN
jgi:hypothetical protein